MNQPAHKTEGVNCPNPKRFHRFTFTGNDPRKGWRIPLDEIKYNEQRDEEKEMSGGHFASERGEEPRSGMQYCSSLSFTNFGARYMDHELMTMWLSVDPMANKYPSISPYAYCAWNPVKLVDPDGRDTTFAGAAERTLYLNYREKVFSDDKYKQVQNELIQLEQSSEVFCVRMGENISSSSGGGNFTYNTSTGQFDINIDGDGIWTDIEKLSHELKHADQYLNRKLTLLIDTKGHATFYNYSVDDELEAYNRQGVFGNTWTSEEVYQVYHDQKHLSWYGINSQYTPSSNDIDVNTEFQKHLGHPKILYHGWENDVKQRQTR